MDCLALDDQSACAKAPSSVLNDLDIESRLAALVVQLVAHVGKGLVDNVLAGDTGGVLRTVRAGRELVELSRHDGLR